MSLSEAWDRMFWAIMIVIFVGLLWMRFLQPYAACEGPGFLVALAVGAAFFYRGYRKASRDSSEKNNSETPEMLIDT